MANTASTTAAAKLGRSGFRNISPDSDPDCYQ